jgi:hypothetical protein
VVPDAAVPSRPVLLVDGQVVNLRAAPGGGLAISLLPGDSGASDLVTLKAGSQTYLVPLDALPYLGRGLDPSLFELSDLQRAEAAGRLRLQVTFGGRTPVLPGAKITHAAGGSALGYLTASSVELFGAALARQFRADHARASYGADGLFGGGMSIALAVPAGPAGKVTRPAFLCTPSR